MSLPEDTRTIKEMLLGGVFLETFQSLEKLKEQRDILNIITNAGESMQWLKRFNHQKGRHEFVFGNKPFCDRFFRLNFLSTNEQQEYIKGKSDLELIEDFKRRSGEEHSYGDCCVSTDEYTRDYNDKRVKKGKKPRVCTFLELGSIAGKPFVLKVKKTPLFKGIVPCLNCAHCDKQGGTYCSSIGEAFDVSDNIEYEMSGIRRMEEKGTVEQLESNVYLIKPENQ